MFVNKFYNRGLEIVDFSHFNKLAFKDLKGFTALTRIYFIVTKSNKQKIWHVEWQQSCHATITKLYYSKKKSLDEEHRTQFLATDLNP